MVEVLLEAKADAFSTNRVSYTHSHMLPLTSVYDRQWDFSPLYFAQKYGHDDVVAILRAC